MSKEDFWARSPLGQSLTRLGNDQSLVPHIFYENKRGLPELYNERIRANAPDTFLVFIHDDVWIDTHFFSELVRDGCSYYDVMGVAGNRRRLPRQPAWHFARVVAGEFVWDEREHLSGAVAHGPKPAGEVTFFGPSIEKCELLDGVLLAARCGKLQQANVFFDTRFDFHFYDLDFCRTARTAGLNIGTWPIAITHASPGAFGGDRWVEKEVEYFIKWGD
jgi:GT2 family glycosyltransferase